MLQRFELSLRSVEPGSEFAHERVEVADQAVLKRELDLEVDKLVGKLRWIGHRDLLSRGMRSVLVAVLVVGCSTPPAAKERVNCRLIAQSIASLELGNYAEPDERGPRERAIEELCVHETLTKKDADCLLASTNVADLAFCPKPLVTKHVVQPQVKPGDICEQYVRTVERIARCAKLPADTQRQLRQQIPQLRQMYQQYGTQQQVQDSCKMAFDATEKAFLQIGC